AKDYTREKSQCQIYSYGEVIQLDRKLLETNLRENTEVLLECNGVVSFLKKYTNYLIKGKPFNNPIIFVNGSLIYATANNSKVTGYADPSMFSQRKSNEIVIYDLSTKQKYTYRNVEFPQDPDPTTSTFVFTVNGNSMTASVELKKIVLYEGKNYSGGFYVVNGKWNRLMNENDFNDRSTSIKVPKGFRIKVFEHANDQGGYGNSIELNGDCPDLSQFGLGKKVSFIEVIASPN
ncbi:MAG: hypothetical protein KDC69_11525, partial [Flavobacteriaceae bacterium]|nr:hypothetical protein [Flavobacteriaceae bacterium]